MGRVSLVVPLNLEDKVSEVNYHGSFSDCEIFSGDGSYFYSQL